MQHEKDFQSFNYEGKNKLPLIFISMKTRINLTNISGVSIKDKALAYSSEQSRQKSFPSWSF